MKREVVVSHRILGLLQGSCFVVSLGVAQWSGSVFGVWGFIVGWAAASIALGVLLFRVLSLTPEKQSDIDEDDWGTFFKVLFWRVIPFAGGIWLLQQWSNWLNTGHS